MFVALQKAQTWCLHTKLYKCGWHTSSNTARMKNSTDLILGEVVYISIINHIPDFWLYLVKTENSNGTLFNKSTSVFSCVCPVIDHEFRHNIVKVAVDEAIHVAEWIRRLLWQCYDEVHCQWQDRRIENWWQFVDYDNNLSNVRSRSLRHKFVCLSASTTKLIDNEN